jgi:hypothetical protein
MVAIATTDNKLLKNNYFGIVFYRADTICFHQVIFVQEIYF